MGVCRFCHQKAGWFAEAHDACVQKAIAGTQSLKKCMADAVIEGKHYSDVSAAIDRLAAAGAIPQDEVHAALISGWSQGAEQRSRAQPISPEELAAMDKIGQDAGFKLEETLWTTGGWSTVFSLLIWVVLHDQVEELRRIQPYQGSVNFNVHAGEVPVWGLPNILLKQQCTTTSYAGGYSGASVRVASGLYYHFGGVRGHRVESASLEEIDYGDFLLTTRAIYFGGFARGINFRLPYGQIIRFQPYSDAVGICRNAAREQILFQSAHTLPPGWPLVATQIDHAWGFCSQTVPRLQLRFQIAAGSCSTFFKLLRQKIRRQRSVTARSRENTMSNEDWNILLLVLACGFSVWLTVLFVRLCGRVKAIKAILMVAYDLEQSKKYGGIVYRKSRSLS